MADTMQFDLVSPERRLASVQATEVLIPGAEGDLTAMKDHAPTITTLRPGILKVMSSDKTETYLVTGGFAEINAAGTSVLAERAFPTADVTEEVLSGLVSEAEAARDNAVDGAVDSTAKYLADLVAAGQEIKSGA